MATISIEKEKTVYRISGDQFLTLEFGDKVDLSLNFKAIIMREAIIEEQIEGIREIIIGTCSMLINYDPYEIKIFDLMQRLRQLEDKNIDFDKEIPSRLIKVPLLFNDRWTRECAKVHNLPPDLEFIAEYNGLSIEEFIRAYTGVDYWVKYVGFSPGLIAFNALDATKELRSPQLKIPRTWTPRGALGVGNSGSTIYAGRTPGGIRMAGRTPLLTFDIEQRNPVFEDSYVLFKPGDRIRLIPIVEGEYLRIEENISSYQYEIEEGVYSRKWLRK